METFVEVGKDEGSLSGQKHWSRRAAGWLWEKSRDLVMNVITLGRWRKYKQNDLSLESFWSGWFISDKVTWCQAFVVFKWAWIEATIIPVMKAFWAKITAVCAAAWHATHVL